jgi:hypothetical protein
VQRLIYIWRTFEVKTRVEVLKSSGVTRVWLPAGLISKTPFQKRLSSGFSGEGGEARIVEGRDDGLEVIAAEFPAGVKPILTHTSRIATKDYAERRRRKSHVGLLESSPHSCVVEIRERLVIGFALHELPCIVDVREISVASCASSRAPHTVSSSSRPPARSWLSRRSVGPKRTANDKGEHQQDRQAKESDQADK